MKLLLTRTEKLIKANQCNFVESLARNPDNYLDPVFGTFSSAIKLLSALLKRLGYVNISDAIGLY